MGKWEEKITHAAHIKKHTRGTSNEISFDVLDAAKNALDGGENGQPKHSPLFGRIALFTLPTRHGKPTSTPKKESGLHLSTGDFISVDEGAAPPKLSGLVSSPRTVSPADKKASVPIADPPANKKRSFEEEIARRKARRRLSRIVAIVVVVVVSVGLMGAGGMYLYRDHQVQQGHVKELDEALDSIKEADKYLQDLDEVISNPFAQGSEEKRKAAQSHLKEVDTILQRVDAKARDISLELHNGREKEAANQTVAAIAARFAIAEQGQLLIHAADGAQDAVKGVDDAWKKVMEGDSLERQAVQLIADTTEDNVKASKDKTSQSIAALNEASEGFTNAQNAYPLADLSKFIEYLDKRRESLGYAIASDDAFLSKDTKEAAAKNEAYNSAEAQAAELAKELPETPSSVVVDAYNNATSDVSKAYSTARLQASSADVFINDYLGTGSK